MVFHWSLNDSKYPQVSFTILSILTILNNAIVWMVSMRPPTSNSPSPFNNPRSPSHLPQLMFFYWSLSDSKSPQISKILLNIITDLNDVVWMVSIRPLISESSSSCTNPLVTAIIIPYEFFTTALTDGLLQEFEWQQVAQSNQDSSQYSCQS